MNYITPDRAEMTTDGVAVESQRLYELLQPCVDEQIKHIGFVPATE